MKWKNARKSKNVQDLRGRDIQPIDRSRNRRHSSYDEIQRNPKSRKIDVEKEKYYRKMSEELWTHKEIEREWEKKKKRGDFNE